MHVPPRSLAVALGLALAFGLAIASCGPKQKFCADAGDGVCHTPIDAPVDTYEAPAMEMGSTYIGADGGSSSSTD